MLAIVSQYLIMSCLASPRRSGSPSPTDVHLNDDGLPVTDNGVRHGSVVFLSRRLLVVASQ